MEFSGQYLTHEEYRGLGGTLDLMPFNLLELEARKQIDKYTFGRLKNLETQKNEVKLCMFNLITALKSYNADLTRNKAISSESIDGYSISYQTMTKEQINGKASEIKGIVSDWLNNCSLDDGTPYLYRGVR